MRRKTEIREKRAIILTKNIIISTSEPSNNKNQQI